MKKFNHEKFKLLFISKNDIEKNVEKWKTGNKEFFFV